MSIYDCKARGTAVATRDGDVQQILTARVRGNTATAAHPKTIVLGDEIQITSTYLGLTNAWYTVQRFEYTTKDHMTTLLLHPRVSTQGYQQERFGSVDHALQKQRQGNADKQVQEPASNE